MTKNDWLTTNLSERTNINLCSFSVSIRPYKFTTGIFKEEAKRVARDLCDTFDNLYIAYSGGLDSEFVLKTFHENGLPITPILVDTPYNQFELEWAYNYCKQINVKPEILTYTQNEIVDKLKIKTVDRGWFSLLGGVPLILCDELNKVNGKLLTGYGEPFTTIPGFQPEHPISEKLEFCEWDYYIDSYDPSHPSGFFSYDLGLFYSLVEQIRYDCSTQSAKYLLYELPSRMKMFWKEEFYAIFRELKPELNPHYFIQKPDLFETLKPYKK